ncbi:MAG: hypothetical protein SPL49_11365 [Oribacterium sp.]|nr:hypothetical protein [Oribacterium sp.]MDY6306709.1 hypothetical protein [Oribacterium sp.]MDY6317799.1 hypothetical protein [Oribacterium sp.]
MKADEQKRITETTGTLEKEYKQVKALIAVMIGVLILAVIMLVLKYYIPVFLLLFAAVILQIFVIRPRSKHYTAACNEKNILLTAGKRIGAESVREKGSDGLTEDLIRKADLLPADNIKSGISFFEGIEGRYRTGKVSAADIVLTETFFMKPDGKGRKHVFQNCGCWTHIELKEEIPYDFRMFHDNAIPAPIQKAFYEEKQDLKLVKASNFGLPKEIYVYTKNDTLPTDKLALRFLDLQKYTPGSVAMSVRGNMVDVYIKDRFLGAAVSLKNAPTEQSLLLDPYPELKWILELTDEIVRSCSGDRSILS